MGSDFDFDGHELAQGDPEDGNPLTGSSRMRKRISDIGVLLGMVAIVVAVLAVLSSLDLDQFSLDDSTQAENATDEPESTANGSGGGDSGDSTANGSGGEDSGSSGDELGRKPVSGGPASGGSGSLGGGFGPGGGTPVAVDDIIIKNGNSGGVISPWHTGVLFSGDVSGSLNLRQSFHPMTGLLNGEGEVRNGTPARAERTDVVVTMHPDGTITITKDGELIGLLSATESAGEFDSLESVGDVTIDADRSPSLTSPNSGGGINQTGAQIFDLGNGKALVKMEDGSTVILEAGEGIRFNADGSYDIGDLGDEGFNVGVDQSGNVKNDADVDITEGWSEANKEKWNEALGEAATADEDQAQPADEQEGAGAATDESQDQDADQDDQDQDDSEAFNLRPLLYVAAGLAVAAALVALVRKILGRNKDENDNDDQEDKLGDDEPTGPPKIAHEDAIRTSLEEQIQAITLATDPRMAIQQAYLLAEGGFGVPALSRRPSESPGEFVQRCVGGFGQPAALRELVRLFEIARYSREPVTESMRSDARSALIALKDAVGTDDRVVL